MLEKRKAILLPVENWVDILSFVDRLNLGQNVSLTCRLFHQIGHQKMHQKGGHFVPELIFDSIDQFRDWQKHSKARLRVRRAGKYYEQIPIAFHWPIPANILGFEHIIIRYLDMEIFQFLRLIRPLLSKINLIIWSNKLHSLAPILSLFSNAPSKLTIYGKFDEISQLFPLLIGNVQMLEINGAFMGEDILPLRNWLNSPRAENNNKMASVLILSFSLWTLLVEQIKQVFAKNKYKGELIFSNLIPILCNDWISSKVASPPISFSIFHSLSSNLRILLCWTIHSPVNIWP